MVGPSASTRSLWWDLLPVLGRYGGTASTRSLCWDYTGLLFHKTVHVLRVTNLSYHMALDLHTKVQKNMLHRLRGKTILLDLALFIAYGNKASSPSGNSSWSHVVVGQLVGEVVGKSVP